MTARTRGRPQHRTTAKNRRLVEELSGVGIPQNRIAFVLGIAKHTLIKHYFAEIERGAAVVEARLVRNLARLAEGDGSVALRAIQFSLRARFGWSEYAPPRPPEIGKKAALQQAVEDGPDEGDEWSTLLQ